MLANIQFYLNKGSYIFKYKKKFAFYLIKKIELKYFKAPKHTSYAMNKDEIFKTKINTKTFFTNSQQKIVQLINFFEQIKFPEKYSQNKLLKAKILFKCLFLQLIHSFFYFGCTV